MVSTCKMQTRWLKILIVFSILSSIVLIYTYRYHEILHLKPVQEGEVLVLRSELVLTGEHLKTSLHEKTNTTLNQKNIKNENKQNFKQPSDISNEGVKRNNKSLLVTTPGSIFNFSSGESLRTRTPVRGEDNIIFLETSCVVNQTADTSLQLRLTPQQGCALESAARTNPRASVYLLYTCPLDSASLGRSSQLVRRVFRYPNVHVWHQSMDSFFGGTPLEALYRSGQMMTSRSPRSHASDVIRFLALWKFGGTYLDLDFIVRRSLAPLGSNYACAELRDFVASGAMSFGTDGAGAEVADACVEELRTNFRGDTVNHNGPALISRVLKARCRVSKTKRMTRKACHGFTVLDSSHFYPVMYKWRLFYDEPRSSSTMAKIAPSYAVHLWNSLMIFHGHGDGTALLRRGTRQPILLMQQEFCPTVYEEYIGNLPVAAKNSSQSGSD